MNAITTSKIQNPAAAMGKNLLQNMIESTWADIYQGTKRIVRFKDRVEFPNTALQGMGIQIAKDHLKVTYANDAFRVTWEINSDTGKPEKFLFSSNWNSADRLFVPIQQTFMEHLAGLAKVGAL